LTCANFNLVGANLFNRKVTYVEIGSEQNVSVLIDGDGLPSLTLVILGDDKAVTGFRVVNVRSNFLALPVHSKGVYILGRDADTATTTHLNHSLVLSVGGLSSTSRTSRGLIRVGGHGCLIIGKNIPNGIRVIIGNVRGSRAIDNGADGDERAEHGEAEGAQLTGILSYALHIIMHNGLDGIMRNVIARAAHNQGDVMGGEGSPLLHKLVYDVLDAIGLRLRNAHLFYIFNPLLKKGGFFLVMLFVLRFDPFFDHTIILTPKEAEER